MGVRLPRFSASTAIAFVFVAVSPALAMGGAGVTTDSSDNHRPPELPMTSPAMQPSEYDLAMRLVRHKQYADAIPHLELALADRPQDADILNALGLAKRMVGDYDGSLYYYGRALAITPDRRGVHESLGELYLQKNDLASAQKELATMTTLCPSGCDERNALAAAIASYRPSASPAAGAAMPP